MFLILLVYALPLLLADTHNSDDFDPMRRTCGSSYDCAQDEFCDRDGFCVGYGEGYVEPEC
jgi:hypothetical protein